MTVEYDKGVFYFDGIPNDKMFIGEMEEKLKSIPYGGTFYAKSIYDPGNIINVLTSHWFDTYPEIYWENEEFVPLPYEEGVVY